MSEIVFPEGQWYDCCESEHLTHDTPEEAIEYMLDDWAEPGCDMVALIREHGELTVTAYNPIEMTEDWLTGAADGLVLQALEAFDMGFCSAADDGCEPDKAAVKKAAEGITAVLRDLLTPLNVYDCEEVGHVDLTVEQTEALMRKHNQHWFEPAAGVAGAGEATKGEE